MKLKPDISGPVIGLLVLFIISQPAWAQRDRIQGALDIEVTKISMKKIRNQDSEPRHGDIPIDQKTRWLRVIVDYRVFVSRDAKINTGYGTDDLWIDQATFQWTVVMARKGRRGNGPSVRRSVRFKKKVRYQNIRIGDRHRAMVFIEPKTYDRYSEGLVQDGIFVHLGIKLGGKTKENMWAVGTQFERRQNEARKMFPRVRGEGGWFASEEVSAIDGGLLCRLQTPWRMSSYQHLENIVSYE